MLFDAIIDCFISSAEAAFGAVITFLADGSPFRQIMAKGPCFFRGSFLFCGGLFCSFFKWHGNLFLNDEIKRQSYADTDFVAFPDALC